MKIINLWPGAIFGQPSPGAMCVFFLNNLNKYLIQFLHLPSDKHRYERCQKKLQSFCKKPRYF